MEHTFGKYLPTEFSVEWSCLKCINHVKVTIPASQVKERNTPEVQICWIATVKCPVCSNEIEVEDF